MSEWREVTLGEVAEVAVGPAFKSAQFSQDPSDMRLLRGANVGVGGTNWSTTKYWPSSAGPVQERYSLRPGDIVLAMDRPWIEKGLKVARLRKVDAPALLVQRVARLRANASVSQGFLSAAVSSRAFEDHVKSITSGTSIPHISATDIKSFTVRVPSTALQRRIAAVLSAFDELIEINERRIELLEDLARSLYREWFVHFRFPGHEDVEMVGSELGPIPEGWTISRLGQLMTLKYGKSLPAKRRVPGSVPVVSSAGIIDAHDESLVAGPGVVVGRKGNAGSVWWIEKSFFPIDTTYYVDSRLPLPYVFHALAALDFIDSHAAVPGLSRDQAYAMPMVAPPEWIVTRFGSVAAQTGRTADALRNTSRQLATTRDLLLPRLVTGRLDISDLDLGALTPAEVE